MISAWMFCVARWDEYHIKIGSFECCDRCFPSCSKALNSNILAEYRWWDRSTSFSEWHFAGAASIWEGKMDESETINKKIGRNRNQKGIFWQSERY
jgi:hypothetical protein